MELKHGSKRGLRKVEGVLIVPFMELKQILGELFKDGLES